MVTIFLYGSIVVSLAELASMAPTAGGQYHWVSEFAPPGCQKFMSYATGWMSTLGWLASTASSAFICTTLIQSLAAVKDTDYTFSNWAYTLVTLLFLILTIFFNTLGASSLPMIETISLVGHLAGFCVIIIPVFVMAPKNSGKEVFTSFTTDSGWDIGTACLITQIPVLYCNLGK